MKFKNENTSKILKKCIRAIDRLPANVKNNSIILIGPAGTGKSTIAESLAKLMPLDRFSLDDDEQLSSIYKYKEKFHKKNFEAVLTAMVLSSLKKISVIDFGAGHSIYKDSELREKMELICSKFPNVILLLPSENIEKSKEELFKRRGVPKDSAVAASIENRLRSTYDSRMAKNNIVYQNGETPEETAERIIEIVKLRNHMLGRERGE